MHSHRAKRRPSWIRSKWAIGSVAFVVGVPLAAGQALATNSHSPSTGGYEIDGNLIAGNDSPAGLDWVGSGGSGGTTGTLDGWTRSGSDCSPPTGAAALPVLICDPVKSDATTFPGGAKESDPPGWLPIGASQVTPKTDITNVYADGQIDSSNSHPVIVNGMERLPKSGDVHLDFEFNQSVTGTGASTIPNRSVNDLLVAYDLGGSVSQNLGALHIRVYKARANLGCNGTCPGYDYATADVDVSGGSTVTGSGVTAQMNTGSVPSGAWKSFDDHGALANNISAFGFAEASIDVNGLFSNSSPCVNFITVKSRSSESVTSQLKDTTRTRSFPFCGGLHIKKFIDYDADGARDTALNATTYGTTTEPFATGWHYNVTATGSSTSVCSGDTAVPTGGGDAELSCPGLSAGSYTVTETQKNTPSDGTDTDYVGTLPANNVLTQTVNVTVGGSATATFGNACYVKKTFRVTSVPSGTTPHAWYRVKNPTTGALSATATVTLAQDGTTSTWNGIVDDVFLDSSQIAWGYGAGTSDLAVKNGSNAANTESFVGSGSGCSKLNSVQFAPSTVTGLKFKDVNENGIQDSADPLEVGLADFKFKLTLGTTELVAYSCGGTHIACGTNAVGTFIFSDVNPGAWTLSEDLTGSPAGWAKVGTSVSGTVTDAPTVNVAFGSTPALVKYGNTPLSTIAVTFTPLTSPAKTQATVSCLKGTTTQTLTQSPTNTYTSGNLHLGTYVCTVVVTDP